MRTALDATSWNSHEAGPVALPTHIDPAPLIRAGRNWTHWIGPLVSVLMLGAVVYELRSIDLREVWALLPTSIGFWLLFLAYYLAGPASEWLIFRRLWGLPLSGMGALLQKLVSNEILLGYLGEVYFYAWARRSATVSASPFGAIKDVTILSALAGNVVTLAMVLAVAPLFGSLHFGIDAKTFLVSIAIILGTSAAALFVRKRLFTLPRRELWFVTSMHLLRIVATILLAAGMWHLLLPSVALLWWLILATARQLLARLPFLPNKDVVFAAVASLLVGQNNDIVAAMALMATLILAAHLLVGAALAANALASREGVR